MLSLCEGIEILVLETSLTSTPSPSAFVRSEGGWTLPRFAEVTERGNIDTFERMVGQLFIERKGGAKGKVFLLACNCF